LGGKGGVECQDRATCHRLELMSLSTRKKSCFIYEQSVISTQISFEMVMQLPSSF